MEITRQKNGDTLVLTLAGRLDANWCNHVQNALTAVVRDGEHRVNLDMAGVSYVSSAGLRVLLSVYKQLKTINGRFGVIRPSAAVQSVLELAGLEMLIATEAPVVAEKADTGRTHESANATYDVFEKSTPPEAFRLERIGDPATLGTGVGAQRPMPAGFGANSFALGVGALGTSYTDSEGRFGEFLAIAGSAAFQPADGSSRPDFVVSQGALVPEGYILVGLSGEGTFPTLVRFEAKKERRTIALAELTQTALTLSGASAAAFVAVTETAGLVGASLRKSPALAGTKDSRFGFPQIRDFLSFTTERAFRDSTSLLVGVVAQPGTSLDPLLRPLGGPALRAHIHAAAFPYRPLRKGRIDLKSSVTELFDGHALQAVLHLLADPREFNGAGDSEFSRGALWLTPVAL
ncbi:MAG: STAS domain-containing protein [Verrucomicrobiota bacterium]